jgi:hypothetical protein
MSASAFRATLGRSLGRGICRRSALELLGVGALCEAEDGHVHVVLTARVAGREQGQSLSFAEEADCEVVMIKALIRREPHFVRSPLTHPRLALLSLAVRHTRAFAVVAARARRYLPRTEEGHAFTERRAALLVYSRMRTKKEHF